ncbi:MAG: alpha/beta hydrolase [candidate division FCPU426 bacterium]
MQERIVKASDGVKLRCVEHGSGPLMFFIPGWGLGAQIWSKQLEHFSKDHRVISFDPRGQGASDKPASGYSTQRRAQDLAEILDSLETQDAVMIGWSLGALDLLRYLENGGKARAAVFVDNSLDPAYALGLAPGGRLLKKVRDNDYAAEIEAFVRGLFRVAPDPEWVNRLVAEAKQMPREAAVAMLQEAGTGEGLGALLRGEKRLPVYWAVCSRFEGEVTRFSGDFPDVNIEVFQDAGHALFVDEAGRFNRGVASFLAAL